MVRKAPPRCRLTVEALEERTVLSTFNQVTGALSPFSGINGGGVTTPASAPALADVDGDGDLDLVLGVANSIKYFKNTGTATNPVYVAQTGGATPFVSFGVINRAAPTLGDIDGDGDLDLVVGQSDGTLRYYKNTGTANHPAYAMQFDAANPFNGFSVGTGSKPSLGDVDGDGDRDLIVGAGDGTLRYWMNTGTATSPVYSEQTGTANRSTASRGASVGRRCGHGRRWRSRPRRGAADGTLRYWKNTATATNPVYVEQTGAANPFDGFDVGAIQPRAG